jgi:hypothetical protein
MEIPIPSPKVPPGDDRVALGKKHESKHKNGSTTHKAGTPTEADVAHHGKSASNGQAIKAPTTLWKREAVMLTFVNNHNEDIWLVYMFYSPDTCGEYGNFQGSVGITSRRVKAQPCTKTRSATSTTATGISTRKTGLRPSCGKGCFRFRSRQRRSLQYLSGHRQHRRPAVGLAQFDVGDYDDFIVYVNG